MAGLYVITVSIMNLLSTLKKDIRVVFERDPAAKSIFEVLLCYHGSGIVIGETTIIGKNVTLYQGVTLGGTGKEKGKRHPTIGNNVVVACGAKVLGSFTVGDHAKIGAGSVVVKPVPAYATVVGIPGRVILIKGEKTQVEEKPISPKMRELAEELDVDLSHDKLPDPELDMIKTLSHRISDLQLQLEKLKKELEDSKNNHA